MAYLTAGEATQRLRARYGIEAGFVDGDIEVASCEVDARGPWAGEKASAEQEGEFPRAGQAAVPDRVLDAVALTAYRVQEDDGPAVRSESVLDASVTYETAKESPTGRRVRALLAPYLLSEEDASIVRLVDAPW